MNKEIAQRIIDNIDLIEGIAKGRELQFKSKLDDESHYKEYPQGWRTDVNILSNILDWRLKPETRTVFIPVYQSMVGGFFKSKDEAERAATHGLIDVIKYTFPE